MAKKAKSTLKNVIAGPVNTAPQPYKPTKEELAERKRYQAEDDIRTLRNAEEIRKDKERMNAAKQVAKSQIQDLKKI